MRVKSTQGLCHEQESNLPSVRDLEGWNPLDNRCRCVIKSPPLLCFGSRLVYKISDFFPQRTVIEERSDANPTTARESASR